jgi:hypothetical protein
VADAAVEDVRVVVGADLAARGVEGGGVLSEQLYLLLGSLPGLFDSFAALSSALD